MSDEIELNLLQQIKELEKKVNKLEGKDTNGTPTYSFSKIRDKELEELFSIEQKFDNPQKFDFWFDWDFSITEDNISFLKELITKNIMLINFYHEEDLKINFIAPLINKVDFFMLDKNIRSFYDEKITYITEKFIFNGEADFIVSKGIKKATNPYFFIQEFKRGEDFSNPRPQLLAELISAIELNNQTSMKGAYIVGATWNFVILEKLAPNKYQYFISYDFNSTNIEDLKSIYKNLLFIKDEIIDTLEEKE